MHILCPICKHMNDRPFPMIFGTHEKVHFECQGCRERITVQVNIQVRAEEV
jgi:hypothetical protein